MGKALNWQRLAECRKERELVIGDFIVIVVAVEDGDDKVLFAAAGFGERLAAGEALALEHEGTILADETGVSWSEDAIGNGGREFGEDAADICSRAAGDGLQLAGEIGTAKTAVRGVGMG